MHAGAYHSYLWEIRDDALHIESANRRIGLLKRIPVHASFNNTEQATWFAQARIDAALEELSELEAQRSA